MFHEIPLPCDGFGTYPDEYGGMMPTACRVDEQHSIGLSGTVDRARGIGTQRSEILDAAASVIAPSGPRISMREIAAAAGKSPGSLYHNFNSKDSILLALVERYYADLERIGADGHDRFGRPGAQWTLGQVVELGLAIARCAVKHRAALQMSFYAEPCANEELVDLLQNPPFAIQNAMLNILRAGVDYGAVRQGLDLPALADRICQSMMHVGLDVVRHTASSDQVAAVMSRIMLQGVADRSYTDDELNCSSAFAAAEDEISSWTTDGQHDLMGSKTAYVRAVARAEFGRRGYDATTVRDIASAAGLCVSAMYCMFGSKAELFASIMDTFGMKSSNGFARVMRTRASPAQKLDALSWITINALNCFPDEWKIQLAWTRQHPPNVPEPVLAFTTRLSQVKGLLTSGIRTRDLRIESPSISMLSRCVMDALWVPENLLRDNGVGAALTIARNSLVRGIVDRGAVRTSGLG